MFMGAPIPPLFAASSFIYGLPLDKAPTVEESPVADPVSSSEEIVTKGPSELSASETVPVTSPDGSTLPTEETQGALGGSIRAGRLWRRSFTGVLRSVSRK